jgi:hypothetical protein
LDDGTCTHEPLPVTEACVDAACMAPFPIGAFCDAQGACVSNVSTDCIGFCVTGSDCSTAIVFDGAWLTNPQTPLGQPAGGFWTFLHAFDADCFLGMCEGYALVLDAVDNFYPAAPASDLTLGAFPIGLSAWQCPDFLDGTLVAQRGSCIESERFLLDPNVTRNYYVSEYALTPVAPNANQWSLCLYRYACSAVEHALLDASLPLRRDAAAARLFAADALPAAKRWLAEQAAGEAAHKRGVDMLA